MPELPFTAIVFAYVDAMIEQSLDDGRITVDGGPEQHIRATTSWAQFRVGMVMHQHSHRSRVPTFNGYSQCGSGSSQLALIKNARARGCLEQLWIESLHLANQSLAESGYLRGGIHLGAISKEAINLTGLP